MTAYILRRTLLMLPTLLGMTAVVFFIMAAAPGSVAELLISSDGEMRAGDRQARIDYIKERYGLDDPAPVQYLRWLHKVSPVGVFTDSTDDRVAGYGLRVGTDPQGVATRLGLKTPDLGHSFIKNRPVTDILAETLPITLLLNLLSVPLVYVIAIFSGVYAARHRGGWFDVASSSSMLALWSVPTIWAGVLLQGFLANESYISMFPTSGLHGLRAGEMRFLPMWGDGGFAPGWLLDTAWHLVLPVVCLSYGSFAFMSKLTRSAVLENMHADFVRTARAKGLPDRVVLWQHTLRNSLLPLITMGAFIIPGMLGGSVIVEYIFGIPGMGKLMIEAIEFKDQEVVMAVTLMGGVLTLIAYLVADLCYAIADPRVSYE